MPDLTRIHHIFILMLENRSFDHLLGHLSLPPNPLAVNGIKLPLSQWANPFNGHAYPLFELTSARVPDPLHDRAHIDVQIDSAPQKMRGFVTSYGVDHEVSPDLPPPVMGFYTAADVPMSAFLARSFTVCDAWFAPLPASTQPNRLMAMAGYSRIDDNTFPLPYHRLVYDWLKDNHVEWRVYHEEVPFFLMMPEWSWRIAVDGHFQRLFQLKHDIDNNDLPPVVFIEPTYTDAPHHGAPSDAHPPSSISTSESLLHTVYSWLRAKPEVWAQSALIVTYDEHGGFFDHVAPQGIPTPIPPDASYTKQFLTTGVRVPGLVASPFAANRVCSNLFDHTSILKFLAERFANAQNGGQYSPEVTARCVESLSVVFDQLDAPHVDAPPPPPPPEYPLVPTATTPNQRAFEEGVERMVAKNRDVAFTKFPELR